MYTVLYFNKPVATFYNPGIAQMFINEAHIPATVTRETMEDIEWDFTVFCVSDSGESRLIGRLYDSHWAKFFIHTFKYHFFPQGKLKIYSF